MTQLATHSTSVSPNRTRDPARYTVKSRRPQEFRDMAGASRAEACGVNRNSPINPDTGTSGARQAFSLRSRDEPLVGPAVLTDRADAQKKGSLKCRES
jgi:hypothetical protein